jgi:homoaconitate hydratase
LGVVGRLAGVTGKDVIITLCGLFNQDEVLNHAVEVSGDGVASLTVDDRLAIANMTTEWGALTGLFPVDDVALTWLRTRAAFLASPGYRPPTTTTHGAGRGPHPRINDAAIAALAANLVSADPDAYYAKVYMHTETHRRTYPHTNKRTFIHAHASIYMLVDTRQGKAR